MDRERLWQTCIDVHDEMLKFGMTEFYHDYGPQRADGWPNEEMRRVNLSKADYYAVCQYDMARFSRLNDVRRALAEFQDLIIRVIYSADDHPYEFENLQEPADAAFRRYDERHRRYIEEFLSEK